MVHMRITLRINANTAVKTIRMLLEIRWDKTVLECVKLYVIRDMQIGRRVYVL